MDKVSVGPWKYEQDGSSAYRAIENSSGFIGFTIENKVAIVGEKTMVRVRKYSGRGLDELNWIEGPTDLVGADNVYAREWCDTILLKLGYIIASPIEFPSFNYRLVLEAVFSAFNSAFSDNLESWEIDLIKRRIEDAARVANINAKKKPKW